MLKDRFPDFVPDRMDSKEQLAWLYADQRPTLIAFASYLLSDQEEAREAVQEVFTALLLKAVTFDNHGHAKATLITATRNKCYDNLRQKMRQQASFGEYLQNNRPDLMEYMGQRQEEEEASLLVIQRLTMANQFIERLDSPIKEVFVLRWIKHKSYKEICAELQIGRTTAHNYTSKAMKALQAMLKDTAVLSLLVLPALAFLLRAFTSAHYFFDIPIIY